MYVYQDIMSNTLNVYNKKDAGWQSGSSGKSACVASVRFWVQNQCHQKKRKKMFKVEN
jgi:hypothetical protein